MNESTSHAAKNVPFYSSFTTLPGLDFLRCEPAPSLNFYLVLVISGSVFG